MDLGNGLGHLTYSTLVHPGDTWDEMWASLTTYVPQVKDRVAPDEPFGVSLRLSAASARTLASEPDERDRLKEFLADTSLYLYTVNAFPYGDFKGALVKEQVYEPDWRSEERTRYTTDVADVLADVAARGNGTVDPDRPARLQAAGHRTRRRRQLHRARDSPSSRTSSVSSSAQAARSRSPSSRNPSASSRPPTRPSTTSRSTSIRASPPPVLPGSPESPSPRHTPPFAATSASSSTSATRLSSTKTSPPRCRSSSTPASPSSSSRKPPPSTCPT